MKLNPTYSKIILIISMLLCFSSAHSQNYRSKDFVSVKLDVIGRGAPSICVDTDSSAYYFVVVNVLNNQDTTINLTIMTCSWVWENFVTNSDSVLFSSCFLGCDYNVADIIKVPPKKFAQFYGTIKNNSRESSTDKVKVGFGYFAAGKDIWDFNRTPNNNKLYRLFWSNEVELKDNIYSFRVR
jgi:hypothetical protein